MPKQLVSMGAYLCIWPDKLYINTADITDRGRMDASYTSAEGGTILVQMCRLDGTDYDSLGKTIAVSNEAPSEPANGALWIDTSGSNHVLMQYSDGSGEWTQVATVYCKITAAGIGSQYKEYDTLKISGLTECTDGGEELTEAQREQLKMLEGDMIIYARGDDFLVVAGIVDRSLTLEGRITAAREVPDLDYITESNNRLWGCKYGMRDGVTVNEIYASKLGDFRNWHSFMGLSTDSYTVSVGSDGKFTGACTLRGVPMFFKESCVHKVSGSAPSNYTMTTTVLRGVEEGSEQSMVIVDEVLYYKGRTDVCSYDGSLPQAISAPLGDVRYHSAVAGAFGGVYYISMQDDGGKWSLFTWDTKHGTWHKEDELHALCFTQQDDSLYCIDAETKQLLDLTGTVGYKESRFGWMAVFGALGLNQENHKYVSRYNIRVKLDEGATLRLSLQYDSSGEWEEQGEVEGDGLRTYLLPVLPRRCDHLQMKLEGRGGMVLYSIGRVYEDGSDG